MARLLVLTVMVKKIGYMGAIISRNMAISLRTSAKSLGEGSEVTGHKEETSIMADPPFPSPFSLSPIPPHLHCFALQSNLLLLGIRGCAKLERRRMLWAVRELFYIMVRSKGLREGNIPSTRSCGPVPLRHKSPSCFSVSQNRARPWAAR